MKIMQPDGTLRDARPGELPAPIAAAAVPAEVTNYQARAVLLGMPSVTPDPPAGRTLFHDVDDALRAAGGLAWQAWEYANVITRGGATVQALAAQFGLTEAQLDDMFRAAALIEA